MYVINISVDVVLIISYEIKSILFLPWNEEKLAFFFFFKHKLDKVFFNEIILNNNIFYFNLINRLNNENKIKISILV